MSSSPEQDQSMTTSATDDSHLVIQSLLNFPSNDDEILKFKNSLVDENKLIKIIDVQNCPTTSDASKLFSNSIFRSALESLNNFTILKLNIDEKLNEHHAEKPRIYEFNIERNFLVSFESIEKNFEHQKIIYWKNSGRFLTIKLIEEFSSELTDFVRNFLVDNVDSASPYSDYPELIDLIDSNGYNLLMKAVDAQSNPTLIDELLNHPFYINKKSNDGKSAADIAWEKKNFEILHLLLEANSTFPKNFNSNDLGVDDASNKIEKFLNISNQMHKAIKSNDSKKVKELIDELNLSCFYNSSNVSAATIAIKLQKPEIYKLLTTNECVIGPEEDFNQIIQQHHEMKSKITLAHDNASKQLQERHLMILLTNSVICHDNDLSKLRRKLIKEAFNILNDIPLIQNILKLTAMHRNFKIRFDFKRSSVEFMNPSAGDQETRGLCQNATLNKFFVYIGAKSLLDENEKFSTIGTLAHELCHFAMDLTFFNSGKPYAIDDHVNEAKFNKIIIGKFEHFENVESIVELVYKYSSSLWPSELIVRVPHMTAYYKNDSHKLNELKETFIELFDYYNQDVEPKILETQSMLRILFDDSIDIKFDSLTEPYKALIHQSIVEFQGVHVSFNEIIKDKNSETFQSLTSEQIRGVLLDNRFLKIGITQKQTTNFYTERDFVDMDFYNFDDIKDQPNVQPPDVVAKRNEENKKYFKNFNEISTIADETKMILLSDFAGAGKTTTFQRFAVKLKEKFPSYWVSYIDLKRHIHVYEKFEREFDREFDILTVLLEIIKSNDIEKKIFKNLFKSNRVILLYDGVDEIAPNFNKFFMDFIANVRDSTKNQQWIATRPQHMKELTSKFNQKAYELKEYDEKQQIEFIQNVLKNLNVDDVMPKEIFLVLKVSINGITVNSPLMLKILTEIYVSDKSILREMNSYSIFDKMIDIKKNIIEEKGKVVGSDRDNRRSKLTIWQVHQIYALKLLYQKGFEDYLIKSKSQNRMLNINEFHLLKRWKNQKLKWTSDAISRYGFLIVDNWNTNNEFPDFYHRSFARFFVAQFLIEDIYELDEEEDVEMSGDDLELRVKLLFNIIKMKDDNQHFILSFVDTQKRKTMNKHFFNFITSSEMQKLLIKQSYENITLFKILSFDERFLKEFKFNKRRTIFQEYLTNPEELGRILKIMEIYEDSLGAEWFYHTGYGLRENFSLPSNEEIEKILHQNTKSIHDREIKESLKLFKLLCFIDEIEMTPRNITNFFRSTLQVLFKYSFMDPPFGEKLFKIIKDKFCNMKTELGNIISQGFNITVSRDYVLKSKEYNQNVLDFYKRLEKFLCSDGTVSKSNFTFAFMKIFISFCGIGFLIDLNQSNFIPKAELQDFTATFSVIIICCMCLSEETPINDFLLFFKKIFKNDKTMLMKFLETRNTDLIDIELEDQTVLSFLNGQIAKKDSEYNEMKCIMLKETFIEMAKEVGITDDEIEKFSNVERSSIFD